MSTADQFREQMMQKAMEQQESPDWRGQWDEAWQQHQGTRDAMFEQSYADEARAMRHAQNVNAQMGAGMGGGLGAGMAQAALGGAQQRMQAESDWQKRGVELRMANLDRQMRQAESMQDRASQAALQQQMNDAMMEMTAIEAQFGATPETLRYLNEQGGGGGGGGPSYSEQGYTWEPQGPTRHTVI
jgi:hypothetical protein